MELKDTVGVLDYVPSRVMSYNFYTGVLYTIADFVDPRYDDERKKR